MIGKLLCVSDQIIIHSMRYDQKYNLKFKKLMLWDAEVKPLVSDYKKALLTHQTSKSKWYRQCQWTSVKQAKGFPMWWYCSAVTKEQYNKQLLVNLDKSWLKLLIRYNLNYSEALEIFVELYAFTSLL